MKKKQQYYEFSNYPIYGNDKHINKIKLIVVIMFVIIVAILLIVMFNGQNNIQTSFVTMEQMQENIKNREQEKEDEKKEIERLADELRKEKAQLKEKQAKLPKLTDVGIKNMKSIYSSDTKRAFLTFDDGPSSVTPKILETLKKEKIKATFFMLGTNVKIYPKTVKQVYDEGHYIANHGYTHIYSSIYASTNAVLDEYNKCNKEVQKAIGEPEFNSHLFRFPGGLAGGSHEKTKKQAKTLLEKNNILSVDWNALTGDAESQKPKKEQLMKKLKVTTKGKSSVVILMHDAQAKKVTAEMLPDIISYLREQGYEFKSFYDIIK